jgi:hypothetical protein
MAYSPRGEQGIGVDESGSPYQYVRFYAERRVALFATLNLTGNSELGLEFEETSTCLKERRLYVSQDLETVFTSWGFSFSSFYEQRMKPTSRLDPRVRVSFGSPAGTGIAVSASYILDPVVLAGTLGLRYRMERPCNWLTLDVGAGFVANSHVSLIASGSLGVPLDTAGLPASSVSFQIRYSCDPRGERELALRLDLHLHGYAPWMRIDLALLGRGP